jgi:RNA polymerase sigma factor (TIGR02999 family)
VVSVLEPAGADDAPSTRVDPARGLRAFDGEIDRELYAALATVAHHRLRAAGLGPSSTLTTTGLVHEAYLRLGRTASTHWEDRAHFLATASVAMRHVLIDRARANTSAKRGGRRTQVTLDDALAAVDTEPSLLLEIDDALEKLAAVAPRLAELVMCRFYGGMTDREIAEALHITPRTVQRDWLKARMLLHRALAP